MNKEILIGQVRKVLLEAGRYADRTLIYRRFENECKGLQLSESDFYKTILKPAYNSIDWASEELIAQGENAERLLDIEDHVKTLFESNNILSSKEINLMFTNIETLSINPEINVKAITNLLRKYKFTNYPPSDTDTEFTKKETVISVNWYKLGSLKKKKLITAVFM